MTNEKEIKHGTAYRIFHFLAKFILVIFALILLLFGLINLPPVQQFLTSKATTFLEKKLNTNVEIGKIGWSLPDEVIIEGVYLETPKGDSLFSLGSLEVGVNFLGFVKKQVQIDYLGLRDVTGNIYVRKDTSNIAFITDAFITTDTSLVEKTPTDQEVASPWEILIADATLDLQNINVLYDDVPTGIRLDLDLGALAGQISDADIIKNNYQIDNIGLKNTKIDYQTYPVIDTSSSVTILDYTIGVNDILLENVAYSMKMDSLQLATVIPKMEANTIAARFYQDSIGADVGSFVLEKANLNYNLLGTAQLQGFDANHLDLSQVTANIEDLTYSDLTVTATVNEISGMSGQELDLQKVAGQVTFDETGVYLEDFILKTARSEFAESRIILEQNFLDTTVNLANMRLNIDIPNGELSPADVLYFSPDLATYLERANDKIRIATQMNGSLSDLSIDNLDFNGFGTKLQANGTIQNALNTNELGMDLNVAKLEMRGANIRPFLPDSILPVGTELPQFFTLNAQLKGKIKDSLRVILNAQTRRENEVATRINLRGKMGDLLGENLFYDFNINKFSSSNTELNAYMPDGILPDGYQLPQSVNILGNLSGTLNSVAPNLQLTATTPAGQATLRTVGEVSNFTNPDLDIALTKTNIDTFFLAYVLPDSLLPSIIRLPEIKSGEAEFTGTLEDLTASLDFSTSAGDIVAKASIKNDFYSISTEIKNLSFLEVTAGSLYDTLAATNLNNLNLSIVGKGRHLDSLEIARGSADFLIKEVNSKEPGLRINANLKPEGLEAKIIFDDIAGEANASFFTDLNNKYRAEGIFGEMDFKDIPYVRYPIVMNGEFKADARYDSLTNMTADVILNDFNFKYNREDYPLENMVADVDFLNEDKKIKVESDWMNADVEGNFYFAELSKQIENLVYDYIREDYNEEVISAENSVLTADVIWKKTDFLTSGIVPGLEQIEPFELKIDFESAEDKLTADVDFPLIVYAGTKIENFTTDANTAGEAFNYDVNIATVKMNGAQNMGEFKLAGGVENGLLTANLVNIDTTGATNLNLTALTDFSDENYRLRFAEEATLNNRSWQFSTGNEIIYNPQSVKIKDWKLSRKAQSLSLMSVGLTQLQAAFEGFKIQELLSLAGMEDMAAGAITGTIDLDDPLTDLRLETNLRIDSTKLYGSRIGQAKIQVDNREVATAYDIDFSLKGAGNDTEIVGTYDMENPVDALNFATDIKSLNLAPFEVFGTEFIRNLHGIVIADANISGNVNAPSLDGFVQFKNAGVTINQLGAPLDFGNQKIILDGNAIRFKDFKLIDSTGNEGTINAYILTEDFRDYSYDLDIAATNFLVLDTNAEDNDLYYGKMIVDATAKVTGDLFSPVIEASASPKEGSDLTYVVPASSANIDYGEDVVTFVNGFDAPPIEEVNPSDTARSQVAQALNMTLRLNLDINDDLDFTAIVDPVANNQFNGKGEGYLSFTMFPNGEMEMAGQFIMREGTYDFEYAAVVKREFNVVSGSTITWTGDIFNPQLDVKVQYKVKANAKPLGIEQEITQTFIVQLNITGTLEKTDIATDLLYPDVNGNNLNSSAGTSISNAITRLQQNSNKMNEQVFGLILFNAFVSESLAQDANLLNAQGGIGEAISNQLNNLAGQYVKFVELDFGLENYQNYDAQGNSTNQTNVNLTVRKRLFQDRLVISVDGETSSETNNSSTETQVYLDNLSVEYNLTKNGNWRVRVYNSRDADDPLAPDVGKTGTALIISKDFNHLFKKKKEE